jgi:pilus assembly protein CpaE
MPKAPTAIPRQTWRPLVVCPNAAMGARIRAALAEQGLEDAAFMADYPGPGVIPGAAAQHGSNICFLDIASNPDQSLPLIPEVARAMPLVALNPHKDADLILYCVRLGACEFLSDPTPEEVRALLERLERSQETPETRKAASVFCVLPGKPGAGASTLATYLAIELRRGGMARVLLVDTDVVSGTVAFLLKLKPAFHLGDAIRDWNRMDEDLWARLATPCQGVDVLPAPEDPSTRLEIEPGEAVGLLSFWRKQYDAIVVDVGGVHAAGSEFAGFADAVILAASNDMVGINATRRARECLEKGGLEAARIKLVATRYSASAGLKREGLETALKTQLYALLPEDAETVQAALLDGKPPAVGSQLARGIQSLAGKLAGKAPAVRKRPSFFGLLNGRG